MKNYFTDEQVKDIAHKVDGYGLIEGWMQLSDIELKALMNLAVEKAIGDRLLVTGEFMHKKMAEELRNLPHGLSLYSVKELEN